MLKLVSAIAGLGLLAALGMPASAVTDAPPVKKVVVKKQPKKVVRTAPRRYAPPRRIVYRTVVRPVYVYPRGYVRYGYARPYYYGGYRRYGYHGPYRARPYYRPYYSSYYYSPVYRSPLYWGPRYYGPRWAW